MEKSIKSIATNYGLYLGGFIAIITVLGYATYLELFTKWWFGILMALIIIVFGIVSVAKSKDSQEGILSFKSAFGAYFLTVLLGLLISTIISFVIFNIIDPEAAETLKQLTIEATVNMMEGFGTPAETISETVDQMEAQNNYSIGNIFKGMAFQLVFFSVIGLIVAAIMKRSDPDA